MGYLSLEDADKRKSPPENMSTLPKEPDLDSSTIGGGGTIVKLPLQSVIKSVT